MSPGSNRDLRQSAKIARAALIIFTFYAGAVFTFAPDLVRTGNAALVRQLMPLPLWGLAWLVCAGVLCTRARGAGYAMLALSWLLYGLATAATALTGTMDAPLAPGLFILAAAVAWWLRARAIARATGTLVADDLTLRDYPPQRRYRPGERATGDHGST